MGDTSTETLRVGRYRVRLCTQEVFCGEQRIKLSWRSFEALKILIEAGGEVVERETFFKRLWPDVEVGESSLNHCITKLRKDLGDQAEGAVVETVARRGYRLTVVPEAVPFANGRPTASATPHSDAASGENPVSTRRMRLRGRLALWAGIVLVAASMGSYSWSRWSRYSRARSLTQEGFRHARENRAPALNTANTLFRQALALDSELAPAYAGLAEVMARSVDSTPRQARAMAERAVHMDPRCGECKAVAGWILMGREWRFREAAQYLNEAAKLEPRDAQILLWHTQMLACSGRLKEALAEIDRARALDFKQPTVVTMRAGILYLSGRYEEAIVSAREALGLKPDNHAAFEWIYRSCLQLHRVEEAIAARAALNAAFLGLTPDSRFEMERRWADAYKQGGPGRLVDDLLAGTDARPALDHLRYERATWRMWTGDRQGALDELEHLFDFHPFNAIYLGIDPAFAPLRGEQRFRDLLSRMGLSEVLASP